MKDQRTHPMHISYEDKLLSIRRLGFDTSKDIRWIQSVHGMVIFHANGSVWSTTQDIFEIILEINKHACIITPES